MWVHHFRACEGRRADGGYREAILTARPRNQYISGPRALLRDLAIAATEDVYNFCTPCCYYYC